MTTPYLPPNQPQLPPSSLAGPALPVLAETLRSLFKELGRSQRDFSAHVYWDHTAVSRYLRGERLAPWEFVDTLLREVEIARGKPMSPEKRERIAALHRRALEERNGWSALVQVLRQDNQQAEERARRAESELQALATTRQARDKGWRWSAFTNSLAERGWPEVSLTALERVTARALACLADPTAEAPYRTSGVITAGAQSGRTTIGAGVIARALDAGYRLVIVFSGTLNLLRSQTQRRLEEALLASDDADQQLQARFPLLRLTSEESDYRSMPSGVALQFEKRHKALPLFSPLNLHPAVPRLLVVKQNVAVLKKLLKDLRAAGPILEEVPALIVDFEPSPPYLALYGSGYGNETGIQSRIDLIRSEIVSLLPRAQVVRFEHQVTCDSSSAITTMRSESLWDGPPDFVVSAHPREPRWAWEDPA
ncbi:helix-turn-helix domain-containing protein [Streptomyces sp. McG8]|uniref:helix-turn-helix domain-containing protein n=1 Tax=Streptomyces sp. McG8 TaxID=2725487 RepID=UPI001BEC7E4B|nr:helix-turn-helix domain-containing protein [Streptomyces sp. McG8]